MIKFRVVNDCLEVCRRDKIWWNSRCPFTGGTHMCGVWCPLFGEVETYTDSSMGLRITSLEICNGKKFTYKENL